MTAPEVRLSRHYTCDIVDAFITSHPYWMRAICTCGEYKSAPGTAAQVRRYWTDHAKFMDAREVE